MSTTEAKFSVGQIIHHRMFDYRGVVIDVDPEFQGPEEWYDKMARSRAPKGKPWYHVLVDGSNIQTYVAEQNLEPDQSGLQTDLVPDFAPQHRSGYCYHQQERDTTAVVSRSCLSLIHI